MDGQDLIELMNGETPTVEGLLDALHARRYTGKIPLTLHLRGGRLQLIEVFQSTQIRLGPPRTLDTAPRSGS